MKEFVDKISRTLLWKVVSSKVEELSELPRIINAANDIEDDYNIDKINACETIDSESFDILGFSVGIEEITVKFEMPFVLVAKKGKKPVIKLQGYASGACIIPAEDSFDYSAVDFSKMNKEELLKNKDIVNITSLEYLSVE